MSKVLRPLMFGNRDGKAVITTEAGEVEIHGRDVSRLWVVRSQIMDKADLEIALLGAELRLKALD